MKLASRAAGVAVSTTALVALLAPAAAASHQNSGWLKVCVFGLDRGDEADVEIDGRWADRDEEVRGCDWFRLPKGWYDVRVDAPRDYDVDGDDDARVKVRAGKTKTVKFWVEEDDDHWGDGSYGSGSEPSSPTGSGSGGYYGTWPKYVKVSPGEACPNGYSRSTVSEEVCVRNW